MSPPKDLRKKQSKKKSRKKRAPRKRKSDQLFNYRKPRRYYRRRPRYGGYSGPGRSLAPGNFTYDTRLDQLITALSNAGIIPRPGRGGGGGGPPVAAGQRRPPRGPRQSSEAANAGVAAANARRYESLNKQAAESGVFDVPSTTDDDDASEYQDMIGSDSSSVYSVAGTVDMPGDDDDDDYDDYGDYGGDYNRLAENPVPVEELMRTYGD